MKRDVFAANQLPPTIKIFDGPFTWAAPLNKLTVSVCHLDIYTFGRKKFAVVTEIKENTGPSVTNGSEVLWTSIFQQHGEMPAFETYDGVKFDKVKINFRQANGWNITSGENTWKHVGDWDQVLRSVE